MKRELGIRDFFGVLALVCALLVFAGDAQAGATCLGGDHTGHDHPAAPGR